MLLGDFSSNAIYLNKDTLNFSEQIKDCSTLRPIFTISVLRMEHFFTTVFLFRFKVFNTSLCMNRARIVEATAVIYQP